jgi:hypothetical protein
MSSSVNFLAAVAGGVGHPRVIGLSVKMEQGKPETVNWNPNTRLAATARVIVKAYGA